MPPNLGTIFSLRPARPPSPDGLAGTVRVESRPEEDEGDRQQRSPSQPLVAPRGKVQKRERCHLLRHAPATAVPCPHSIIYPKLLHELPLFRANICRKQEGAKVPLRISVCRKRISRLRLSRGRPGSSVGPRSRNCQVSRRCADPVKTISSVAQRHGLVPNLLFRWRRVMNEGTVAAVDSNWSTPDSHSIRRNGGHDIGASERK